jgi:hypothetical protein
MKILMDENLPHELRPLLMPMHDVLTVAFMPRRMVRVTLVLLTLVLLVRVTLVLPQQEETCRGLAEGVNATLVLVLCAAAIAFMLIFFLCAEPFPKTDMSGLPV